MPETAAPYYRVAADHPSVGKPRPRSAACGSRQGEGRQFQALLATSLAANPRANVNHRRQARPFGDAPTARSTKFPGREGGVCTKSDTAVRGNMERARPLSGGRDEARVGLRFVSERDGRSGALRELRSKLR